MEIGPLQLIVVGFPQPKFTGNIYRELKKVREAGLIRVIDSLAVYKDPNGDLAALKESDVSKEEAMTYGAVIGSLIGLGAGGLEGAEAGAEAGALMMGGEYEYGVREEDVRAITADMAPGTAALMLLFEHTWAIPLKNAVRGAGGTVLAQDMLSPEALITRGAELAAAVAAAEKASKPKRKAAPNKRAPAKKSAKPAKTAKKGGKTAKAKKGKK